MADNIQATPRNYLGGLLSDAYKWMQSPERTQQMQGFAGLLGTTGLPQTVERMAYGEPLTNIGRANVPLLKPETADALMTVAGFAPEIKAAAKMLPKNVPVGMSIKPVDDMAGLLTPTRESFVSGVPAGQEMIVHHNISPQKLARVEQVGGMPVPSIAVSNVDNPMLNFGDISLIGPKEMAIPSAKNPVYGFDAYTARAPKIDYQMDAKSSKKLQGMFADVADDVGGDYELTRLAQNWEDRRFSKPMMAKFLKEKGALPDRKEFDDGWKYNQALSDGVYNLKTEYADWLNDFNKRLPDAGVDIKERIFKGYTDSGNRRYAPATLDNLVKEMKGGAGSEGFMYGVGNIRAVATPKFKTLNQVKAARESIVSSEKFEPIKKQIDSAFNDLTERLGKLEGLSGYRYDAPDALYEIGQSRNVNLLDKIYKDVPESLKADVQVFMNKLREMPTEYFEIKPQRAVQVGEFKGAILPANAPKQSIDYLRNQGLQDLYYYSTPEERKDLFKKFGNEMFAAAPALPLGSGLFGQEEDQTGISGLLGR
jgi:phage-Barnase-EndoU-ColicinE5/D-RelE like nuclease5